MTLLDRLQWVIKNMFDDNMSRYAEASGVSRQTISAAMKRLVEDGDMRTGTLEKLASGAGVKSNWLLRGEGEPPVGWTGDHSPSARESDLTVSEPVRVVRDPGVGHVRLGDRDGYEEKERLARIEHPEIPGGMWFKAADAAFRDLPDSKITPEFIYRTAKSLYDGLTSQEQTEAWAEVARAIAKQHAKIRDELRARGLDPVRDEVEWNVEFMRAKSIAEGRPIDEEKLEAIRSPTPGAVIRNCQQRCLL